MKKTGEWGHARFGTLDDLAHKESGHPAGLNACFGDGHVVWQAINQNPAAFNQQVWKDIGHDPKDYRYAMSLWQQ